MKLPNGEQAIIDREKIDGSLLSLAHPVGRSKAILLRKMGFGVGSAERLARQLREIAAEEDVQMTVTSSYGTKYIVDGVLETPWSMRLPVRTVWIVLFGEQCPRFVTAYPYGGA